MASGPLSSRTAPAPAEHTAEEPHQIDDDLSLLIRIVDRLANEQVDSLKRMGANASRNISRAMSWTLGPDWGLWSLAALVFLVACSRRCLMRRDVGRYQAVPAVPLTVSISTRGTPRPGDSPADSPSHFPAAQPPEPPRLSDPEAVVAAAMAAAKVEVAKVKAAAEPRGHASAMLDGWNLADALMPGCVADQAPAVAPAPAAECAAESRGHGQRAPEQLLHAPPSDRSYEPPTELLSSVRLETELDGLRHAISMRALDAAHKSVALLKEAAAAAGQTEPAGGSESRSESGGARGVPLVPLGGATRPETRRF